MTDVWELPRWLMLGGQRYGIRGDFRVILRIIRILEDPESPEYLRWLTALYMFYTEPIPPELRKQAMTELARFISCSQPGRPGPRLISWEQDGALIAAEINKVAGCEVRALPFVHWWTFIGWSHCIGEGPLSTVVSIREKRRRGQPLEKWEQAYYRNNREQIELRQPPDRERERLEKLLASGAG